MDRNFFLRFAILLVLTMSLASASLGYDGESLGIFKQYQTINITQTCENCTSINITITYPNSTIALSNAIMTNLSSTNYVVSFNSTRATETYRVYFKANENGVIDNADGWFEVTTTGRAKPSDFLVTVFTVLFIMILGAFLFFIVYTLNFFIQFKLEEQERGITFGVDDLIINLAGYLVLYGYFFLQNYYIGNSTITFITSWLLRISAWTNIVLPAIAFVLTIIIWGGLSVVRWGNEQQG